MKPVFYSLFSVLCLLSSVLCPLSVYGQGGEVGKLMSFGAGARSLGLGRAYTAIAGDSTSVYWNPAGLGAMNRQEITALHANLYGSTVYDYMGYGKPFIGNRAIGAEVVRLNTSGIENRDTNNNLTGSFSNSELGFGLGYGANKVFGTNMALGGSIKTLTRSLGNYKNTLYGLDLGGQYLLGARARFGLALHNIISGKLGDTNDRMPFKIRLGAGYELIRNAATIALDVENFKEFFAGTEYSFGIGALRLGYQPEGLALGGGIALRDLRLDYAVINHPEFGWSQRLSLTYGFGTRLSTRRTKLAQSTEITGDKYVADGLFKEAFTAYQDALRYTHDSNNGNLPEKIRRIGTAQEICPQFTEQSKTGDMIRKGIARYLAKKDKEATLMLAYAATLSPQNDILKRLYDSIAKETKITIKDMDETGLGSASQNLVEKKQSETLSAFWSSSYQQVIQLCEDILILEPENILALTRLGSAHYALGNWDKAKIVWDLAVKIAPDDPQTQQIKSFLGTIQK